MNLSIIINNYNDHEECTATVQSIQASGARPCDIVVVDDGSPEPYVAPPHTRVYRCERRIGCGPSRTLGVIRAQHDWVLILDSHMRMAPGWQDAIQVAMEGDPYTIWCGQCLALKPGMMDVSQATTSYFGATLLFTGPDKNAPGKWQVLEGKWQPEQPGDHYELPSLMGACYLMHKSWFQHINALSWLRCWGSDEPSMSLRTWLLGGRCRMLKGLKVGHQFRARSFHTNPTGANIYNKMRLAMTTMPPEVVRKLIADLPKQYRMGGDIAQAHRWITADAPAIEIDRAFMETHQKLHFNDYVAKFGLPRFWE